MTAPLPPHGYVDLHVPSRFVQRANRFFIADETAKSPTIGTWIGEDQSNSQGFAHGGFLLTFADVALTMVVRGITLTLAADFIRPVRVGDWIAAQVYTRKRSRNLIFADAMAFANDKPVLRMNGVFKPFIGAEPQDPT